MNTRTQMATVALVSALVGWWLNSAGILPTLQGQERRGDPGKTIPAPKGADSGAKVSSDRFYYQDINYSLSARNATSNDVRKLNVDFLRDSKTGNLLYLSADNGQIAAVPGHKNFEFLELCYSNKKTIETIRTSPRTGEAWGLKWNNGQASWAKYDEGTSQPPEGDYVFFLFEGENNTYYLDRFDRVSGKGWILTNLKWQPTE